MAKKGDLNQPYFKSNWFTSTAYLANCIQPTPHKMHTPNQIISFALDTVVGGHHEIMKLLYVPQQLIDVCDLFIFIICIYVQMCVRVNNVCTCI